jgi:hypothetical protein
VTYNDDLFQAGTVVEAASENGGLFCALDFQHQKPDNNQNDPVDAERNKSVGFNKVKQKFDAQDGYDESGDKARQKILILPQGKL